MIFKCVFGRSRSIRKLCPLRVLYWILFLLTVHLGILSRTFDIVSMVWLIVHLYWHRCSIRLLHRSLSAAIPRRFFVAIIRLPLSPRAIIPVGSLIWLVGNAPFRKTTKIVAIVPNRIHPNDYVVHLNGSSVILNWLCWNPFPRSTIVPRWPMNSKRRISSRNQINTCRLIIDVIRQINSKRSILSRILFFLSNGGKEEEGEEEAPSVRLDRSFTWCK